MSTSRYTKKEKRDQHVNLGMRYLKKAYQRAWNINYNYIHQKKEERKFKFKFSLGKRRKEI